MSELKIDFYKPEYHEQYMNYKEELFNKEIPTNRRDAEKVSENLEKNGIALLFAEEKIIGDIVYIVRERVLTIFHFNMLQKYRNQRLGSKLIEFIKNYFTEFVVEVTVEGSTQTNKELVKYYESLGFESVSFTNMRLIK